MFIRIKRSGGHEYLQVVESYREQGKVRQRVIATLGRRDQLADNDALEGLASSLARFTKKTAVLSDYRAGNVETEPSVSIGPAMVFDRLWQELGLHELLGKLLEDRRFEFPLERAIFLTVLHRLCDPGSDRAADRWHQQHRIEGSDALQLHHLYRAMAWLGEPLEDSQQVDATLPDKAPRCVKDLIEERLFDSHRDLFSDLSLVFFDTTSIYFEGDGGDDLGQYGFSKDHRPDCKQMVVGAIMAQDGMPICSEMWPGNVADVTTLLPVIRRLKSRFGIDQVCIVADRGMIAEKTIQQIETKHPEIKYILGARLRSSRQVRDQVLGWPGRFKEVHGERCHGKDPSPLKVKDVRFSSKDDPSGRRYVVCHNEEQARKDRADREAILASLQTKLNTEPDKALVGNKGYRKYIRSTGKHFAVDREKVKEEARFDGKWVLRTNWSEPEAAQVALKYKQLWMVEDIFRTTKSILATRPIYHRRDETIRGHVFCSFLALVLRHRLQAKLGQAGHDFEWKHIMDDLGRLEHVTVHTGDSAYRLRTSPVGVAGKVLQAVGVGLGPTIRYIEPPPEGKAGAMVKS